MKELLITFSAETFAQEGTARADEPGARVLRVLKVAGEVDLGTGDQLAEAIFDELAAGEGMVLDLSEVEFLDSSGLMVLIKTHAKAAELGVPFGIVSPHEAVTKILRVTGTDAIFSVYRRVAPADRPASRC